MIASRPVGKIVRTLEIPFGTPDHASLRSEVFYRCGFSECCGHCAQGEQRSELPRDAVGGQPPEGAGQSGAHDGGEQHAGHDRQRPAGQPFAVQHKDLGHEGTIE